MHPWYPLALPWHCPLHMKYTNACKTQWVCFFLLQSQFSLHPWRVSCGRSKGYGLCSPHTSEVLPASKHEPQRPDPRATCSHPPLARLAGVTLSRTCGPACKLARSSGGFEEVKMRPQERLKSSLGAGRGEKGLRAEMTLEWVEPRKQRKSGNIPEDLG